MTAELDLFKQITNAVLDLQNATLQSYPRPLKALARLLRHPDLATANAALTQDLNLDAFLAESERSQRGMMGSAELAWPDSTEKVLGLSLLLIEKFAENPDYMAQLGHVYFYTGSKILPGVQAATSQIIIPFLRDYKTYVLNGANSPTKLVLPLSKRGIHRARTGHRREGCRRAFPRQRRIPVGHSSRTGQPRLDRDREGRGQQRRGIRGRTPDAG